LFLLRPRGLHFLDIFGDFFSYTLSYSFSARGSPFRRDSAFLPLWEVRSFSFPPPWCRFSVSPISLLLKLTSIVFFFPTFLLFRFSSPVGLSATFLSPFSFLLFLPLPEFRFRLFRRPEGPLCDSSLARRLLVAGGVTPPSFCWEMFFWFLRYSHYCELFFPPPLLLPLAGPHMLLPARLVPPRTRSLFFVMLLKCPDSSYFSFLLLSSSVSPAAFHLIQGKSTSLPFFLFLNEHLLCDTPQVGPLLNSSSLGFFLPSFYSMSLSLPQIRFPFPKIVPLPSLSLPSFYHTIETFLRASSSSFSNHRLNKNAELFFSTVCFHPNIVFLSITDACPPSTFLSGSFNHYDSSF